MTSTALVFVGLVIPAAPLAGAQVPVEARECVGDSSGLGDASCDPEWAIKHTGFDAAKQRIRKERNEEPGQGIVVGVLDTGYATYRDEQDTEHMHPELLDFIIEKRGYSFECDVEYDARRASTPLPCPYDEDQRQARDRMDTTLIPQGRQPGHGTGPLSVLASPHRSPVIPSPNPDARVVGVVPGVKVVVIRSVQGVVLMEKRAWDTARGIARLVLDDPEGREPHHPPVDVISISQGGRTPHTHLQDAVLAAERRGIIVVAAAGQGSLEDLGGGPVRFPAQYPSVVAVGGTTVDARPWTGLLSTGKGRALDTAAPAVKVWRAAAEGEERKAHFRIGRGKGTSFAAPQAAGAAALWLQWYGRDALQARYGREALASAFILHLRKYGARSPQEMVGLAKAKRLPNVRAIETGAAKGWPRNMGPGILAADKLIALPLEDLPTRADVCRFVYDDRGASAVASVCPPRECPAHDAVDCAHDQWDLEEVLKGGLIRPAYHVDPRVSLVLGTTIGRPFGSGRRTGHWYSPALSLGAIWSRHHYRIPRGLLVQAKGGEHGFSVGFGYADLQGYGPLRNAEDKYATIPGFGGILGYSGKLVYLYTAGTSHVGGDLGFALYRFKVNAGFYGAVDSTARKRWRWSLDAGFGF
jgi:hypothetical protein